MPGTFYRWFSERRLTRFGRARRDRVEKARLAIVTQHVSERGTMLEIGPGQGSLAAIAVAAGWTYRGIEASPGLAEALRSRGLDVVDGWTPPIGVADAICDVIYADQVLEHMSGIDAARAFVAEAYRGLRPGGVLFVVVPDYLKERAFFWDVDYTHNFVTTERRVRQLLYDGALPSSVWSGASAWRRDRGVTSSRSARCWRIFLDSIRCRGTPALKTCSSGFARTCSKRWPSWRASR